MNNLYKIAIKIAMRKKAIMGAQQVADWLKNEAVSVGIPIERGTNLWKLAVGAIKRSSNIDINKLRGGFSLDDLVITTVTELVLKKNSKVYTGYSSQYVKEILVPEIVLQAKSEGVLLEELKDPKSVYGKVLEKIAAFHSIPIRRESEGKPDLIEKVFSGAKKSMNNTVSRGTSKRKKIDLQKLMGETPTANIFEKFDGNHPLEFIKFWTTSVVNKALNVLRDHSDPRIDDAKPFGNFDQRNTLRYENEFDAMSESRYLSRHPDGDEDEEITADDRLMKEKVLDLLERRDERYLEIFEIVKEHSHEKDQSKEISEKFGLSDEQAKDLLKKFKQEMKRISIKLELDAGDMGRILHASKRVKKIANAILRRFLNVSLL